MTRTYKSSELNDSLYKRASGIMPGGVSSPVRAFRAVGGTPRFFQKGEGAYLYDVDASRYTDFQMGFGPLILGHANPEVVRAVREAAANGLAFGTPHPDEVALATELTNHHPAADWVRFTTSGTEAVMSAVRLARAATGRDLVLKFDGCYHGHSDALLVKGGSGLATFGTSSSAGVPAGTVADTAVLPLDDDAALEGFFAAHGERLGCVLMEGVPANAGLLEQRPGFLKKLQKLARDAGALFILDEVITGYRLGLGGAASHYGLKPDLVTFGKIIGGGLPVGAYGGRRDLMELVAPLGPVYQAGTLAGNPLAMAAGLAQVRALARDAPYNDLATRTTDVAQALTDLARDRGVPVSIPTCASMLWLIFGDVEAPRRFDAVPASTADSFRVLHANLLQHRGAPETHARVFLPPSAYEVLFMSTAHSPDVIDDALPAFDAAFKAVREVSA